MKVCFVSSLFKIGQPCGPSVFVENLSRFLKEKGVDVSLDPSCKCDILFVVISADLELVEKKIREGARVIQRLDGVCFDKARDCEEWNRGPRDIHRIADLVIYQSLFSKEMCHRYLGLPRGPYKIIYNPVDTDRFTPYGKKLNFEAKNLLFSVSTWRPHKRLQDSIAAVKELLHLRDDFLLLIIGRGVATEGRSARIKYLDEIPHRELPIYYRSADVFLYPSWVDWCPNVVLEALASGTPVICTDTGGTPELVGDGGVIIKTGEVFDYEPKDLYNFNAIPKVDPRKFAQAINLILENKKEYSWRARRRARGFSLEVIGNQYLEAIKEVLDMGMK